MLQSQDGFGAIHLGDAVTISSLIFARMYGVDCGAESEASDVIQEPLAFRTLDFIPNCQEQVHLHLDISRATSRALNHFFVHLSLFPACSSHSSSDE